MSLDETVPAATIDNATTLARNKRSTFGPTTKANDRNTDVNNSTTTKTDVADGENLDYSYSSISGNRVDEPLASLHSNTRLIQRSGVVVEDDSWIRLPSKGFVDAAKANGLDEDISPSVDPTPAKPSRSWYSATVKNPDHDNLELKYSVLQQHPGAVPFVAKTPEKGDLDNFFDYINTTELGVTIQTVARSPDKTTSTVSWSVSPDSVAAFPKESLIKHSKDRQEIPRGYSPTAAAETLANIEQSPPAENRHRFLTSELERNSAVALSPPITSSTVGSTKSDLLRVYIESSSIVEINRNNRHTYSSFCVPISVMLQREIEMFEAARSHGIAQDRWSSSRVFRMWRKQQRHHRSRSEFGTEYHEAAATTIHLTPEISLQKNYSSSFRWKAWLTTCIRSYYQTGILRIPHFCEGDDILLALEYLGILTADTDMYVFESAKAFERIQAWSTYFTFRRKLAETLLDAYEEAEEQDGIIQQNNTNDEAEMNQDRPRTMCSEPSKPRVWVLMKEDHGSFPSPNPTLQVGGSTARSLPVRAEWALYDLFCETNSDHDDILSCNVPCRLRHDFCTYVRQSLPPRTGVRFNLEIVEIISANPYNKLTNFSRHVTKPVFRIEPIDADSHVGTQERSHDNLYIVRKLGKNGPEPSIRSASFGYTKSHEDAATSKSSTISHDQRWKMPTDDPICTKTLAGIGVARACDMSRNVSLSAKDPLVSHQQLPHVSENYMEPPKKGIRAPPMKREVEPTSPSAIRVQHPDSGLAGDTFSEGWDVVAPITYINTDFGDLGSVTSILSEPVIDPTGNVGVKKTRNEAFLQPVTRMDEVTAAQEEKKKRITEAAMKIIRKRTYDEGVQRNSHASVEDTKEASEIQPECIIQSPQRPSREPHLVEVSTDVNDTSNGSLASVGSLEHIDLTQECNTRSYSNITIRDKIKLKSSDAADDPFASWGVICASVCEAVIPVYPRNKLTSSPSRMVTMTSPRKEQSVAHTSKEGHRKFAGCQYSQNSKHVFDEDTLTPWFPPDKFSDEENVEIPGLPTQEIVNPDGFLDRAKKLSRDLSTQVESFIKMAFEAPEETQQIKSKLLPTIPEEDAGIFLHAETLIEVTTKKHREVRTDAHAIPKSHSLDSSPVANVSTPLPPHQSRRSRSKITVLRKKNSPNSPSSNDSILKSSSITAAPVVMANVAFTRTRDNPSVSSLSDFSIPVPGWQRDTRKMLT